MSRHKTLELPTYRQGQRVTLHVAANVPSGTVDREAGPGRYWVATGAGSLIVRADQMEAIEDEDVPTKHPEPPSWLAACLRSHEHGECPCDLTEGGQGLCTAGQWLDGMEVEG